MPKDKSVLIASSMYFLNFLFILLYFFAELRFFLSYQHIAIFPEGLSLFALLFIIVIFILLTYGILKLKKWALKMGVFLGAWCALNLIIGIAMKDLDVYSILPFIAAVIIYKKRALFK